MTARLIIELSSSEDVSACLMDGAEVRTDPEVAMALADCTKSGDAEDDCRYVLSNIGVEFRIVARNAAGEYENRLATHEEKARTCKAIYFESDRDWLEDESWCEVYLIWEAAHHGQD